MALRFGEQQRRLWRLHLFHLLNRRILAHCCRISAYFNMVNHIFVFFFAINTIRLDLLLRAKNLGHRTTLIRRMRVEVIVILCTFIPIYLFSVIAAQLNFLHSIMVLIYISVAGTLTLLGAAIVFYLLIVGTIWINTMDEVPRKSKRVRQIVSKNWCLLVHNLGTIFIVLPANVIRLGFATDLPNNFTCTPHIYLQFYHDYLLVFAAMVSLSLWITMITFFAFLQNFLIRKGFGIYYLRALQGRTVSPLSDSSRNRNPATGETQYSRQSKASVNSFPATIEMKSKSSSSDSVLESVGEEQ